MKDYAPERRPAENSKKYNFKRWLWPLLLGCSMLIILWTTVGLIHHRHLQQKLRRKQSMLHHTKQKLATSLTPTTGQQGSQLDFYHLLPSMQVKIKQPPKGDAKPQTIYQYTLQIASSRDYNATQKLAKKMQQLHISIRVESLLNQKQQPWYKIMAGPFTDVVEAQDLQDQLRLKGYNALLIKKKLPSTAATTPPPATNNGSTTTTRAQPSQPLTAKPQKNTS